MKRTYTAPSVEQIGLGVPQSLLRRFSIREVEFIDFMEDLDENEELYIYRV